MIYSQDVITKTNSISNYFKQDEQNLVIFSDYNKTLSLPLLFIGSFGNTSFYFSPGLGYDSLDGINLGLDLGINQKIKNMNFSIAFGLGLNYYAVGGYVSYDNIGVGYYTTFFGNAIGPDNQSNKQIVGGIQIFTRNFSLRFENDFLYKGEKYDRWRTAAFEIDIKNFILGTYIYSNEPDKVFENYSGSIWETDRQAYSNGEIYRSVFYVGYRYSNRIIRIGINHPVIQDIIQNGWHTLVNKPYFNTPYGRYFSFYFYIGYYNPFSLYGK